LSARRVVQLACTTFGAMNFALNAAGTAALNALIGGAQAPVAQKRTFHDALGGGQLDGGLNQEEPYKAARGAADFRGKGWVCVQCGNMNQDGHQFCNTLYCQTPRPVQNGEWQCVCGNVNYATRTICGMRKCQLPRPGGPRPEQVVSPVMGQVSVGGINAAVQSFAAAAAGAGAWSLQQQPPEGSWACLACGNVNWPTRDTCNGRMCGRPRAEVDGGPYSPATAAPAAPVMAAHQPQQLQQQQQQHQQQQQQWQQQQQQRQQPLPEGCWSCLACGNINWPTRDTCNKRSCGRPRAEVDGGQPAAQSLPAGNANRTQATPPEGSWVCTACNNVNWPTRDTCNKRICGRPRAEVDGGPPPTPGTVLV